MTENAPYRPRQAVVEIAFGRRVVRAVRGQKQKLQATRELALVSEELRLSDGTVHEALLLLHERDSGEHWGTAIWLPDGSLTWQDDADFFEKLGKRREEVFPYRYRYDVPLACEDIHLGPDGWSRGP